MTKTPTPTVRLFLAPAAAATIALAAAAGGAAESETATEAQTPRNAVEQVEAFIAKQNIDKSKTGWRTKLPKPPAADFGGAKKYTWVLDTNKGTLKIALMPDVAPMHVTSTLYLTQLGFYDGLTFHRIIPGFMAQGGCPLGTGTGGPGYQFGGEFDSSARHDDAGVLSMANAGPNTDGSQFFITFGPTPHLNGKHTVFGRVVDGKPALTALESVGSGSGKTKEKVEIRKATIEVS